MQRFDSIARNRNGATTVEYAAVASLISIVAYGTMEIIGSTVAGLFGSVPTF